MSNKAVRFLRLLRQFPWLTTLGYKDVEITVNRLGKDQLLVVPASESWDGSLGASAHYSCYWLVVDGKAEEFFVEGNGSHGSNYAHSTTTTHEGETVLNALVRQGLVDRAKVAEALVRFERNYSNWQGSASYDEDTLTIYLPKVNIGEVLAEAEAQEQARIDAELAAIKEGSEAPSS